MVKALGFRQDMIYALEALSDAEIQEKEWGYKNPRGDLHYTIAMHTLLDDTALYDDPYAEIGYVLIDEDEAQAVGVVTKLIIILFGKIGNNREVDDYQAHPDWLSIMVAAKHALEIVNRNQERVYVIAHRDELLDHIRIMADPQLAYSTWVEQEFRPPMRYKRFIETLEFFFYDPYRGVDEPILDWMLYDDRERKWVQFLKTWMKIVFDQVPYNSSSDADYLEVAEWPLVAIAAQSVLRILTQNDRAKERLSPDQR